MTQKEKIRKAFMALHSIRSDVKSLEAEANGYDMSFHKGYTGSIIRTCNEAIELLK